MKLLNIIPGQPLIFFEDLGSFLEAMGCLPPRSGSDDASKKSTSALSRLQKSLWANVDSSKRGRTDLLSLTVFFHILTGAIDEETFKSIKATSREVSASPKPEDEGTNSLDATNVSARFQKLVTQYDSSKVRNEFFVFDLPGK